MTPRKDRKVKEIIFLGTGNLKIQSNLTFSSNFYWFPHFCFDFESLGTSSGVPAIACLTDPEQNCKTCISTLQPEGEFNVRRNTSLLIRVNHEDGRVR